MNYFFKGVLSKTLSLLLIIFLSSRLWSQSVDWSSKLDEPVFIENTGQHSYLNENVLFFAKVNGAIVHFTKNAVIYEYRYAKYNKRDLHKYLEDRKQDEPLDLYDTKYFRIVFDNSNTSEIYSDDKVSYTYNHTVNRQTVKSDAFKKITYAEAYPGIDIEFIIPEEGGLKYQFVVKPYADSKLIQVSYPDAESVRNSGQSLFLPSAIGTFQENNIYCFQETKSNQIPVKINIKKNIVSYNLGEYNQEKPVIIDPWLTNPITNPTRAFNIDFDDYGNVYVSGNEQIASNFLAKYNASGTLLWDYTYTFSALGDMSVDKSTGAVYSHANIAFINPAISKVDAGGNFVTDMQLNALDVPGELWRSFYDQCDDSLIIGTGGNGYHVLKIDSALTGHSTADALYTPITSSTDVVSIKPGPDGESVFVIMAETLFGGAFLGEVAKGTYPDVTQVWNVSDDHEFKEVNMLNYDSGHNGMNALAVNNEYVYTFDGDTIRRRDITTGASINFVDTEGEIYKSSGIDINLCGDLYVGVGDSILVFDDDLNQLGSIALPDTCYDLVVGHDGLLYACGDGFVTEIGIGSFTTLTLSQTDSDCGDCNGTATLTSGCQNIDSLSVLWTPSGQTTLTATGLCEGWHTVNVFNQVCATQNGILRDSIYVGGSQNEITAEIAGIINESCNNANNGAATVQNIAAINPGQLTVTWIDPSGGVFATDVVNQGGTSTQTTLYSGVWTVIVEDDLGCQWSENFSIQVGSIIINTTIGHPQCYNTPTGSITAFTGTPGSFYFEIKDASGTVRNNSGTNTANSLEYGIYTVSITDDAGCYNEISVTLNNPPSLDVDISVVPPPCYGDATGSAEVANVYNYQGGLDDIIYSWDPSGVFGLGEDKIEDQFAGEYTITIQDSIGCTYEESFFIPSPNPLIGVVDIPSLTYCRTRSFQKGNGEVTATTAGLDQSGTGNVTYHWENLENGDESDNSTFIVNVPGWMEVTLTDDNGCTYIEKVYVDSLVPVADFDLISEQFTGPGEYEGTEDVEVELINTSLYFSKPSYELSDSTSKITWYNNEPGNENGNWFFRYDYNITKTDTVLRALGDTETNYEVCLVAKNFNDCRDTACKILTVHPFPEIEIPNVFTPGVSPNNEFFFPARGIDEFDCGVFNRYGVEVFHFNSIDDKWDGSNSKNGKPCLDGVYFVTYKAVSTNNTEFSGQGNVHLIREKK